MCSIEWIRIEPCFNLLYCHIVFVSIWILGCCRDRSFYLTSWAGLKFLSHYISMKFWVDVFNQPGNITCYRNYEFMKDLKAYKPLQFDYPKSKSGGWESNPICFSAVAFFIQTAPNALLIHASIAVPLNLNLLQPLGTKFMIWEVTLWFTV